MCVECYARSERAARASALARARTRVFQYVRRALAVNAIQRNATTAALVTTSFGTSPVSATPNATSTSAIGKPIVHMKNLTGDLL
jgi:hypothetical protein